MIRRLYLHPNNGDQISLHVVICDTGSDSKGWEVCVDVSFFVYDHVQYNYVTFQDVNTGHTTRFHMKKMTWGFDKLISLESFMESENGNLSLFSKGMSSVKGTHLSILDDAMSLPNGWKVFADFKIRIKSPFTESDIVQGLDIWFCNSDNRGFQNFMLLSELISRKNGFLLNDRS
ncbi:hypothetical protein R6Q57_025667 [Mikania cordata]